MENYPQKNIQDIHIKEVWELLLNIKNDNGYVPFVLITIPSCPHFWPFFIEFVTGLAQRISLVEHELISLMKHLNSPSFS